VTRLSLPGISLYFQHAQGWTVSLLLHAAVVGTAVLTLSDLTLPPEQEPFRLEMSFLQTPPAREGGQNQAPSAPPQEPPRAAEPFGQEVREVVEPVRPVTNAVPVEPQQMVKPVEQRTVVQKPEEPETKPEEVPPPQPVPVEAPKPAMAATEPAEQPSAPRTSPTPPAPSEESVAMVKPSSASVEGPRADYGWLAKSLWHRVVELKRYPHRARLNHWEGKVVLRAVIRHDGHLADLALHESSGYDELDEAAMELVREACPLHLAQPLGREQVVVQVPITYALSR
jgi:protein TonB